MAAWCRIELLGGLRVIVDGRTISRFRTQKTAALLAYLAYHRDRAHPREALIEMLWPWASLDAGRQSLSQALSSLRHQLEPPGIPAGTVLVTDHTNAQLNPQAVTTDLLEFEAALHAAERAPNSAARQRDLEEAVQLYHGEFLPGLYEPWIPAEQVRLSEEFVGAVVKLARLLAERGAVTAAVSHLRRAISTEPLQEKPYRELMRWLTEQGDYVAALKAYQELEHALEEELGERPSAAIRQLAQEVERRAREQPGPAVATVFAATLAKGHGRRVKLPSGTVTILLVRGDDEGGGEHEVGRWLHEEFKRHGGVEIESERPAVAAAFDHASDALNCAATCQFRAVGPTTAGAKSPVRLTMAIHTAELAVGPDGAYPPGSFQRAERLLGAAHPAQVLCSEASAGLLRYDLNGGLRLRDLGVYRLRGASASERIFQLEYRGSAGTFPALNAESGYASHLPLRLTRFFGRRQEIGQLREMLTGDARLVTVVGPPGCGKTRLAIEAAAELQETFHGAVWFVPLADLRDEGDILDRALDPLGIQRSPRATPLDQIAAALGEEPALIVFDNFEHLIEKAKEVHALLERLPMLRCLVTSRRRLSPSGEREFALAPLPAPEGPASASDLLHNESIALFVDRAQAVKADFQLTPENATTVVEICRRLEGVPLAIELAAARANMLGLAQILERVEKGEDLVSQRRDTEDRHRSLRAAVEWSYELLTPELKRLFARLSVFRGGWTAEAAEVVCEEPMALDHLAALAECSIIQVEQSAIGPRFSMLETLRGYAQERLSGSEDEAASRQRHLGCFLEFAAKARTGMRTGMLGANQKDWFDRVGAELDNVLAAHDWCDSTPSGVADGLRLGWQLGAFWSLRGLCLGLAFLERALGRDPEAERTEARACALNAAGILLSYLGQMARSRSAFAESLSIFEELGNKQMVAGALNNLAEAEASIGEYDWARCHLERMLALHRESGNQRLIGITLSGLAGLAHRLGDYQTARSLGEENLKICRDLGDRWSEGIALGNLGLTLAKLGELESGRHLLEKSLSIHRELGAVLVFPLDSMAYVDMQRGQFESARSCLLEGFRRVREHGAQKWALSLLEYTSFLTIAVSVSAEDGAVIENARAQAVCLLGACGALRESQALPLSPANRQELDQAIDTFRSLMSADCFRACWEEGRTMSLTQAVDRAVALLESLDIPKDQLRSASQTA